MGRKNQDWSNISPEDQKKMIKLQESFDKESKSLNSFNDHIVVKEKVMTMKNWESSMHDKKASKIISIMMV